MTYVNNVTDTLYADVSEFQTEVDDSYTDAGYRVLCIRSNDGTYRDHKFTVNYQWCINAVESGAMDFFLVYYYWRPNTGLSTHMDMVNEAGGPHPLMVSMIDLESGGNPVQDWSDALNSEYDQLGEWLGNPLRAIGYANHQDLLGNPDVIPPVPPMWSTRPPRLRLVGAGYGENPNLPGQIAHQYTNGEGYGGGLPEGAPPFGTCDMNSADGLSVQAFAAACGLIVAGQPSPPPVITPPPPPSNTGTSTPPPPAPDDLVGVGDQIFTAAPALAAQFGV